MKKILFFDCFSGISGDMAVSAFISMGLDFDFLKKELQKIDVDGYELNIDTIKQSGIESLKFDVAIKKQQQCRDFSQIKEMIANSRLNEQVKQLSKNIFFTIASSEAKIHGREIDHVHFHEIGAVDSIIDIISVAIAIDYFNADLLCASPIPLGKGFIQTRHGKMPIPAPATADILKEVPVYGGDFDFEVTTPTGAAIIKTLCSRFGEMPLMTVKQIGLGSGSRPGKSVPNILRIYYGQDIYSPDLGLKSETLIHVSSNIDDCQPEIIGSFMETLSKSGALDWWIEHIQMKKNRPAFKICTLVRPNDIERVVKLFFTETSTFGVRTYPVNKYFLEREIKEIKIDAGTIKVKIGYMEGKNITISPEHESCRQLSLMSGIPIRKIYSQAAQAIAKM
jgi:pyridinium-3,5-bisthiocarboxylic acid mononucleotide nickel chelatase